jgi:hypothetical protein
MSTPYARAAAALHASLLTTWASEEAMTAVFDQCNRGPKFDRTTHGRAVVMKLFNDAWAAAYDGAAPKPVYSDRVKVLAELIPLVGKDFNLLTQVAPNLMETHFDVDRQGINAELEKLKKEFASRTDVPNPFTDKKPKGGVTASTHPPEVVRQYAYAVSVAKAASILTEADFPNMSYRITPFGKTPAFSDSVNFGQLPVVGDAYYRPSILWMPEKEMRMMFVTWGASEGDAVPCEVNNDGSVSFLDLPEGYRTFKSESGGSMLQQSISSRKGGGLLWRAWLRLGAPEGAVIIPRLNSIKVIGPEAFLKELEADGAKNDPTWITFTWDKRPELLKD